MDKQKLKNVANEISMKYAYAPDLVDDTFYISKKHKEVIFTDSNLKSYYKLLCQITYHWLTIPFPTFDVTKPSELIAALGSYASNTFNQVIKTDLQSAVFIFQNLNRAIAEIKLINSEKAKKDAS